MPPALRSIWLGGASASLLGCAGGSDATPAVTAADGSHTWIDVYRSTGSRQCEAGGDSIEALRARLEAAGVTVHAADCGSDGRMYSSVCGGADGRIGIYTIPSGQIELARSAGFAPLSDLPGAQRLACEQSPAGSTP